MSKLVTKIDNHAFEVEVEWTHTQVAEVTVRVNGEAIQVRLPQATAALEDMEWLVVEERPYEIVIDPDLHWLKAYGGLHHIEVHDQNLAVARPRSGDGRLKAPIPGLVTRILVTLGDLVEVGQPVLVLEAMKMENEIRATRAGIIHTLQVAPGQSVVRNEVLAEIG